MAQSTAPVKARKPRPDFPLFPHATGRWAKKVRGKLAYLGKVADDPRGESALELWLEQKDDLLAGRTPRKKGDGRTLRDLVNRFLTSKRRVLDSHGITNRTFSEYYGTCERVLEAFGKDRLVDDLATEEFERLRAELANTRGPVALGNEIQRVRMIFKYGFDDGLIDRPVRYGQAFRKPSATVIRKARAEAGKRMFEAEELRRIVDALEGKPVAVKGEGEPVTLKADPVLRAMILLGTNGGFGNTDLASLPLSALDLKVGLVEFPRPKTGVERRCPLWPETIAALKAAIAVRPAPRDPADAGLVFLTRRGKRWVRMSSNSDPSKWGYRTDIIGDAVADLLHKLKINGRRGLGFYTLRHVFETIGGRSKDPVAVSSIMGHVDNSMSSRYREEIDDGRLRDVTDAIRIWLFAEGGAA